MAPASYSPPPASRLIGIGLVVLLHVAIVYALVTGLAHRAVEVVRAPIETRIIAAAKPEQPQPAPPPPLQLAPPPTAFVPPPEVNIEKPPPPPMRSTAITTPPVRPVAPPPPVPAPAPAPAPVPAAEPARVMPRIDARRSQQPEYPAASRRLGEQGSVVLQVLVDTDGRVIDSKLLQSSGYDRLDQAALAGVRSDYRFLPGTVGGKPQQMWYTFKFTWKLR